MKRIMKLILLTGALMALMCAAASAAEPTQAGIYDVNTYGEVTVLAKTAEGSTVNALSGTIDGAEHNDFFPDAQRLEVAVRNTTSGVYYLTVALEGTGTVPTVDNLRYIDQQTAAGGTVTFNIYPDKLEPGKQYTVYVADNASSTGLTKVAEYRYYEPLKKGDVNGDGVVNVDDVLMILNYIVGRTELDSSAVYAANVKLDEDQVLIDVNDVLLILNYIVGRTATLG